MTWVEHHKVSEQFASQAQVALWEGRHTEALSLYARAADAENKALADLDASKARTVGITAVSAAALYYKAKDFTRAEEVAGHWLGFGALPAFAKDQLRSLLQSIWCEQVRTRTDAGFAPGQVLISVKGGEVVHGGAPLDLIVDKVKIVQSILHRTAEFMSGLAHRKRGGPSKDIREICRPWLFQTEPGSYQFAVAIQEKKQLDMLRELPSSRDISDCFLRVLRVGIEDPEQGFSEVVPDPDYRNTFLKLTRNLAPQGEVCDSLEVSSPDQPQLIRLDAKVRRDLGSTIRSLKAKEASPKGHHESLHGTLRAVHLDKDWLELTVGTQSVHVVQVGDQVDDVIGPMINKPVIVHVSVDGDRHKFLDVEPDESSC